MTTIREVRETDRPIDEVFAYVADFSSTAEWDPGVARARRIDDGPVGPGARYAVDAMFLGRTIPMVYRIVDFEPPHRVVLEGLGNTSTARDDVRFETVGGRTRITWTLDLQLLGPSRLATPLLRFFLSRLGRKALDGLEHRLQSHQPAISS
ncbi:MAG: polyketide cyclase [Rhodobacterales bacterium]|nr:polyketide cyclase [Rhodobacterales bacterium]